MHDRYDTGKRQPIRQQQRKVDVAKLGPGLFFCSEAAHQGLGVFKKSFATSILTELLH
jgi:hypothetical protein